MLKKILLIVLAISIISGLTLVLAKNSQPPLSTKVLVRSADEISLTLSKNDGRAIKSMSLRLGDTGKLVLIANGTANKKIPVSIETSDIDNIYFYKFNAAITGPDEFLFHARKLGIYEYTLTASDAGKTVTKQVQFIVRPALNLASSDLRGSSGPSCQFSDTDSPLVRKFCEEGIINGYPDGSFRPNTIINRAEMMKIAYGLFTSEEILNAEKMNLVDSNSFSFTDVEPDHWAAPYISVAKNLGKIQGYADGSFIPFQEVKRAEAWKMMIEAAIHLDPVLQGFFDLDKTIPGEDAWFGPYVRFGKRINMHIPGEDTVPEWQLMAAPINRLEVVEFMNKIIYFVPTETVILE